MAEVPRILCFSWNSQSIRLCESMDQNVINYNRSRSQISMPLIGQVSIPGSTTWQYDCTIMDFWPKLSGIITDTNPSIVVISFQEDVRPGSYVHSHLLPEEMPKIGYELYNRNTMMGVGRTTVTGLSQADPFVRGLRISVYVRHNIADLMSETKNRLVERIGFSEKNYICSSALTRGKGGSAVYLQLPSADANGDIMAFIDVHLPFNASSLKESKDKNDPMIRQDAITNQNVCLNRTFRNLVLDLPVVPKYVILMGDLNYRIFPFLSLSAQETSNAILSSTDRESLFNVYDDHDELKLQMMKGNIYKMDEGVNNQGPNFFPTCKMSHDRPVRSNVRDINTDDYKLGKDDQRVTSWCDRILTWSPDTSNVNLKCEYYNRMDTGMMIQSDHAGIIGQYTFQQR